MAGWKFPQELLLKRKGKKDKNENTKYLLNQPRQFFKGELEALWPLVPCPFSIYREA